MKKTEEKLQNAKRLTFTFLAFIMIVLTTEAQTVAELKAEENTLTRRILDAVTQRRSDKKKEQEQENSK